MSGPLPERLAQLRREQRLREGGALLLAHGQPAEAARWFEQALCFAEAARAHAASGAVAAALRCAGQADATVLAECLVQLAPASAQCEEAAWALQRLGANEAAARLYLHLGDGVRAAEAAEAAGAFELAAHGWRQAGQLTRAGRALEQALQRAPGRTELREALAALLLDVGRPHEAARLLQPMAEDDPHAARTTALRTQALAAAGLAGRAPAAPAPRDESLWFGRYEPLEWVHRGPRTQLARARDRQRGDLVAIKWWIDPEWFEPLQRLRPQLMALQSARHPHLVEMRELRSDAPVLISAWQEGGNLEHAAARVADAPHVALGWTGSVLAALSEAHARGVLHGDLRPSQVLLDAAGTLKLSDFALASLRHVRAELTVTAPRGLSFMSPEVQRGEHGDARSDLYGAGQLLRHWLADDEASLARWSAPLRAWLEQMTAFEPSARPASAAAALEQLRRLPWPAPAPIRPLATQPAIDRPILAPQGAATEPHTLHDPARRQHLRRWAQLEAPALQRVHSLAPDGEAALEPLRPGVSAGPWALPRSAIGEALTALHAAGLIHGAVDRQHVLETAHGFRLRWPAKLPPQDGRADDDWHALRALGFG